MKITLDYIRNIMNQLDKETGFNSQNMELKKGRMTRTIAYCQFIGEIPKMFKFSNAFLDCDWEEEYKINIIKHEYCHAWSNTWKHNKEFKEKCVLLNCLPDAYIDDEHFRIFKMAL